jgi:O-antigen/teichoic acid export membrane protein
MYSVSYRLGIPMMIFVSVFEYAWKPFYLSNYEAPDAKRMFARVFTYFTMVSAGIFLIASFFVNYLTALPFIGGKFINPIYQQAFGIIPIILVSYYFNGVFTNFAAGIHIQKKTQFLPLSIGIAAIVNIVMNLVLIPIFGYWGAAWATLGAYFSSAVLLYRYTMKIYPITYEWKRIFILIGTTAIIYTVCTFITDNLDMMSAFIVKLISIFAFVGLLILSGFFNLSEMVIIKRFFRRK